VKVVVTVVVVVLLLQLSSNVNRQLSGEASKNTGNANGNFADFNPRAFETG